MIIRFVSNRRLYITGGEYYSADFPRNLDVAVSQIVPTIGTQSNLVDIHFANGTIAVGCDPAWYTIIDGVVPNRLAYKSKMDKLPLP